MSGGRILMTATVIALRLIQDNYNRNITLENAREILIDSIIDF